MIIIMIINCEVKLNSCFLWSLLLIWRIVVISDFEFRISLGYLLVSVLIGSRNSIIRVFYGKGDVSTAVLKQCLLGIPVPKMSDDEAETSDSSRYTHEQKIVAAVWVHEKEFNNQTWKDINSNFLARFNTPPPNRTTFLSWERKLFSVGNVEDREKCGRPLSRLMHVPYVRASLKESPDLSLRERSKLLGLPRTTLLKIIRDDLNMQFEVEEDGNCSNLKRRHAPYGGGKWKKKATEEEKKECKAEEEVLQSEHTGNSADQK